MLELRIMNAGQALPLFDLPTHLGPRQAAREIGDTIEGLIAFMDDLGGDPDLETTGAEDDFMDFRADGPGCPISDPDLGVDEISSGYAVGDRTHAEWHTLPAGRRRSGAIDGKLLPGLYDDHEDAEDEDRDSCLAADDDPARIISDGLPGDSLDAELNGDEHDYSDGLPYWER